MAIPRLIAEFLSVSDSPGRSPGPCVCAPAIIPGTTGRAPAENSWVDLGDVVVRAPVVEFCAIANEYSEFCWKPYPDFFQASLKASFTAWGMQSGFVKSTVAFFPCFCGSGDVQRGA